MENSEVAHYRVGRLIGRGGMGEVHEAVDLDLDRPVALKFIAPELVADAESLRRFEREARAAAALNHPHIAILFEIQRTAARPFIVMELLQSTLRDRIERGPIPVHDALAAARDVAAGLAAAHRGGIVHRDVKPENLMFDGNGAIKLTDFGLARAAQQSRMTMTGSTLGTAAYMAPECVRGGESVGAPTDVFALGVVLHEMLAGELPFAGDSPLAVLYTITNEPPRRMRATRPEVPAEVEKLIEWMLEKDPAARPDAPTVARRLGGMTGREPSALRPATEELETIRVSAAGPPAEEEESLVQPVRSHRRSGWLMPLILVPATAGGLGLLVWGVISGRDAARRHPDAVVILNEGRDSLLGNNLAAASALFQRALELDPNYDEARLNLAMVHMRSGDDTRAADLYGQVLRRASQRPAVAAVAHYNLGEIDLRASAWPSAVDHLRQATALDSTQVAYVNNLGFALVEAGRAREALGVLERAATRFEGEPMVHKNLGLARLRLGDARGALGALDRALQIEPRLGSALALRARARAQSGDIEGARADLTLLKKVEPDSPDLGPAEAEVDMADVRREQAHIRREGAPGPLR